MSKVYKVVAKRSEGWWALTFPGYVGAHSQGRNESEVEYMARDLIHEMLGVNLEDIELDIDYRSENALAQ